MLLFVVVDIVVCYCCCCCFLLLLMFSCCSYPRSGSSSNLENVFFFFGETKTGEPGGKTLGAGRRTNTKLRQPIYELNSGIRTRATFLGSRERSSALRPSRFPSLEAAQEITTNFRTYPALVEDEAVIILHLPCRSP